MPKDFSKETKNLSGPVSGEERGSCQKTVPSKKYLAQVFSAELYKLSKSR